MEYRELESGLVAASYGMDAAALERELKRRDPLLSLQGWPSHSLGAILWRIMRYAGPDRPPDTVLVWGNSQEAFPLSSAILDELDRHDRNNTRSDYKSEDVLDRERREQVAKDVERSDEALADDWVPKHGRPVLPRSQALRMSRDKRRARGEKT